MLTLYRVLLRNVTAGVEVSPDGIVVEAAPVFRKFIGARFEKLRDWVSRQGGVIELVRESNNVRSA